MHKDEDDILLIRSHDGGRTWDQSSVVTVYRAENHMGACNPGISRLSDGTLIIHTLLNSFWNAKGILEDQGPQSENVGLLREAEGTFLMRSTDNGHTWGPMYKINATPMRWSQSADGITELPNGTLLMALTGMEHDPWTRQNQHDPYRSFVVRSDDHGFSWEYLATIAYDPSRIISFHEPGLGRMSDGRLVCLMRTHHAPRLRHGNTWLAYSDDNGESWSRPERTDLWGYPSDLTLLQDGRLLATYGHRREPWGVWGCISSDGKRWQMKDEFVIQDGGKGPKAIGGIAFHTGYPASIQLGDGTILSVWHEFTTDTQPSVQYVLSKRWEIES